jgi:hypothetical protein
MVHRQVLKILWMRITVRGLSEGCSFFVWAVLFLFHAPTKRGRAGGGLDFGALKRDPPPPSDPPPRLVCFGNRRRPWCTRFWRRPSLR